MYRDENAQLQKRLRYAYMDRIPNVPIPAAVILNSILSSELIEANKEVTANYQAVKKNQDLKRSEFEELAMELEEAKTACQLAIVSTFFAFPSSRQTPNSLKIKLSKPSAPKKTPPNRTLSSPQTTLRPNRQIQTTRSSPRPERKRHL